MENLAKSLWAARREAKVTQDIAALAAGCSREYISHLECGRKTNPRPRILIFLMQFYSEMTNKITENEA